ncbi:MAG: hypothetical protein D6791_15700, partial [Chloroflexi bacterium]
MFKRLSFLKSRHVLPVLLLLALFMTGFPGVSAAQAPAAAPADSGLEWRGVVESMPSGGFIGTWVIGGKTFEANAGTRIKQEHGPLQVGVCAKVEYQVVGGVNQALQIERDSDSSGCPGGGGDGGHQENAKVYGRIDSMPAGGFAGTW